MQDNFKTESILSFISQNIGATELDLGDQEIEEIKFFCPLLIKMPNLKALDLSFN